MLLHHFHFQISIFHGAKSAHILCSELLLIATLLPIFEFVRRNVVRGPSGPSQQILQCRSRLAANIAIRARRRRIRGAIDDVCFIFRHEIQKRPSLRYLHPTLFFL